MPMAQLVRALPLGLCHAEHPRFKPHSDHQILHQYITTFHLVLYLFTPLSCLISSLHRP